jgi:hypothetical protein
VVAAKRQLGQAQALHVGGACSRERVNDVAQVAGTTGDLRGRVASWPLNGSNGTPLLSADGLWRGTEA